MQQQNPYTGNFAPTLISAKNLLNSTSNDRVEYQAASLPQISNPKSVNNTNNFETDSVI